MKVLLSLELFAFFVNHDRLDETIENHYTTDFVADSRIIFDHLTHRRETANETVRLLRRWDPTFE